MNNNELELKIKEILKEENFFDMMEKVYDFNKIYMQTSFYKKTKMPLTEAIKLYKANDITNENKIIEKLQNIINNLSLEKFNELINEFGTKLEEDNEESLSNAKMFSNLINELKGIEVDNNDLDN